MTISSKGLIQWSTDTLLAEPQDVEVVVADGQGGTATQKFQIRVASQLENTRPTIISNPKLAGREDRPYTYDAVADDAQGDEVVWSLVRGPIGMSIGSSDGRVRWTLAMTKWAAILSPFAQQIRSVHFQNRAFLLMSLVSTRHL